MKKQTKTPPNPKPTPEDIFSKLIGKKIPYIVLVSLNSMRRIQSDYYSRDYYIILYKGDAVKMKPTMFSKSTDDKSLSERKLSSKEIDIFKTKQHLFDKVKHTNYGRIYEVKGCSFKNYFKSQKLIQNEK
jgi:hypothetical protein